MPKPLSPWLPDNDRGAAGTARLAGRATAAPPARAALERVGACHQALWSSVTIASRLTRDRVLRLATSCKLRRRA